MREFNEKVKKAQYVNQFYIKSPTISNYPLPASYPSSVYQKKKYKFIKNHRNVCKFSISSFDLFEKFIWIYANSHYTYVILPHKIMSVSKIFIYENEIGKISSRNFCF